MGIFARKEYGGTAELSESIDGYQRKEHVEYSLFDLICVGVGATLGSGVFVLTGLVARDFAGPSAFFSWIIAGVACSFSAMSYAEMSNRMPSSGSAYTFAYSTLGELPAYIAGWCLSLECGVSAAAVARNWGVKLSNSLHSSSSTSELSQDDFGFNLYSFLVMSATILLFLSGSEISRLTINLFTVLKVLLVFFMIGAGFLLFRGQNLTPFAPMGVRGCVRGATSCFFGFVGYDEVCCLALESKNAKRHLPLAVFGTIALVTLLYAFASFALSGMEEYVSIDEQSGFSTAFFRHGYHFAGTVTAVGELVTLPLVVVVSFLPQSRVFYAMALDGLLPSLFAHRDDSGNFTSGILACGVVCVAIAAFIPFTALDDVISAGVLFSFNLTNNSLLLVRAEDVSDVPWQLLGWNRCQIILFLFNLQAFVIALLINVTSADCFLHLRWLSIGLGLALLVMIGLVLKRDCLTRKTLTSHTSSSLFAVATEEEKRPLHKASSSDATNNGDRSDSGGLSSGVRGVDSSAMGSVIGGEGDDDSCFYRVPYMPFPPLIGLFINYLLITQLSWQSSAGLLTYFALATVGYFLSRR